MVNPDVEMEHKFFEYKSGSLSPGFLSSGKHISKWMKINIQQAVASCCSLILPIPIPATRVKFTCDYG